MSIRIFYSEVKFRLKERKSILKIIEKVIEEEKKLTGDLSFIFTDDDYLRKINIEFLLHDYNTDVITFSYNNENVINGEIYISVETVIVNSVKYKVSLNMEIYRVMIHGVLHLLGYDDKNEMGKKRIREQENFWLRNIGEEDNGI